MNKGQDISKKFPGLFLVHHNLPGKQVSFHSHAEHLLFIPLQGEIKIILKDRVLTTGPGRMVYLPPNLEHAFDSTSQLGERLIALIETKTWKKAEGAERSVSTVATNQLIKELLFFLLLHPTTKHAASLISALIQTLDEVLGEGCHLIDLEHASSRVRDARVTSALNYMQSNFAEEISMDRISKAAGLSTRNLNRLFLQELSLTPKQCLVQIRIQKAEALLRSGKQTVTEVAFGVGYNSLSQFISSFRLLTGRLPSQSGR